MTLASANSYGKNWMSRRDEHIYRTYKRTRRTKNVSCLMLAVMFVMIVSIGAAATPLRSLLEALSINKQGQAFAGHMVESLTTQLPPISI